MCYTINSYNGMVFGNKLSEPALKTGYVDYKTLANIVDNRVLCCGIVSNTWDIGGWEVVNGSDYDYETSSWREVFQEYIISESGAKFLMEFTDELVYYSENLNLFVWGICHFGTSWDYVMSNLRWEEQS